MKTQTVAIIGENSYIGTKFIEYCQNDSELDISVINSRQNDLSTYDFKNIKVVIHVAGIAHVSTNPKMDTLYYKINRDLPISAATKARKDGVKQFVFLSSMIVYQDPKKIGELHEIALSTIPNPQNAYGRSKLEAEIGLQSLASENFLVSILRLPMVYGEGCKGNFPRLISLGLKAPLFPDLSNSRSMIYIVNLCAYIRYCIVEKKHGLLFPQNKDYVNTRDIIELAACSQKRRIRFSPFLGKVIRIIFGRSNTVNKVFGSKVYSKALSPDMDLYNRYSFIESMNRYLNSL